MRRFSPSRIFVLAFLGLALAAGASLDALGTRAGRIDRELAGLVGQRFEALPALLLEQARAGHRGDPNAKRGVRPGEERVESARRTGSGPFETRSQRPAGR